MNGFWAFLCVLQLLIGLVVAIGFINGLLVVSRSLRGRQATEAESDASFELDNRVAAAAEALACRGTEVREAAALLLGLMGRHPDGARAIKMAQRGLREAGAGVSSHAQPGVAEDVQRAAPASGEAAWRTRAETVAVSRGSAGSSVDSTAQAIVRRWFDIDNITLLLYLGAGLIVIAAGIFVGSSWDAIGPVARWSIVAATALAFFLTGEAFVLYSPKLGRAGETFRGVGMVLLPFVAIAHDAFIQEGRAPVGYWAVVGAGLAAVYYALHRLIAPGRSSAYLAATSVAVTALLLPDVLELTADWRAPSLLLAGAGFLGVAWATDLSREPLARASRLGSMGALAESHLIVGGLAAVASAIVLGSEVDVIRPELSTIVYLAVLGLSLALTAVWQRVSPDYIDSRSG